MKKKLLFVGLITSIFSSAQINVSESFENTTYPGFTNVSFYRSGVEAVCAGTYGLTRGFWSGGATGSTTYSSTASNGGKLDISFKYKTFVYNNGTVNGNLKVEYSIDGGQTYVALQTITLASVAACATWTVSLPQNTIPASADFKLRVAGQWMSGDYWVILDDFKLTQSPFLAVSDVAKKEIKVYPNPFKDVIYLDSADSVKSLTISDFSGRKIKTINNISKEIKVSELKKGNYILTIEYKDGSKNQTKLIKE